MASSYPRVPEILSLKSFLDSQVLRFNNPAFITIDPVSIPHRFTSKEDIEISGFLTAVISWGQRPVILKNATRMMELMEGEPYRFLMDAGTKDWKRFGGFVHRTFNGVDCVLFLKSIKRLYARYGGLEPAFRLTLEQNGMDMGKSIHGLRCIFFHGIDPGRSGKHFADPEHNASAKRINMFLRWMVRKDKAGVDFGIWNSIDAAVLHCPLDVHSGRVARELGLLTRKQDDWKAVKELTENLRLLDASDPVKYDFALFGIGAERMRNEQWAMRN